MTFIRRFLVLIVIIITLVPLIMVTLLSVVLTDHKRAKRILDGYTNFMDKLSGRKGPQTPTPVIKKINEDKDPRPVELQGNNRIAVNKTELFSNDTVIYFEPQYEKYIHQYIQHNVNTIVSQLETKKLKFLYIPKLSDTSKEELVNILHYFFPISGTLSQEEVANYYSLLKEVDNETYYSYMYELLGIPKFTYPCLLRTRNNQNSEGQYLYSVFNLPRDNEEEISNAFKFYFTTVKSPDSGIYFNLTIPDFTVQDEWRDEEDIIAYYNVKREVEKYLITAPPAHSLYMLLQVLKTVQTQHPDTFTQLSPLLAILDKQENTPPSRLIVTKDYSILLPDFNKKIELGPLPKTVFIFMLGKPEGILFKELPQYKNELMDLYAKISNRTDWEAMQQSIDELTNPYSNSMSEKCSRIKEAFLKQIDDQWAKHYYVTGLRGEPKKIILDRKLIKIDTNSS